MGKEIKAWACQAHLIINIWVEGVWWRDGNEPVFVWVPPQPQAWRGPWGMLQACLRAKRVWRSVCNQFTRVRMEIHVTVNSQLNFQHPLVPSLTRMHHLYSMKVVLFWNRIQEGQDEGCVRFDDRGSRNWMRRGWVDGDERGPEWVGVWTERLGNPGVEIQGEGISRWASRAPSLHVWERHGKFVAGGNS